MIKKYFTKIQNVIKGFIGIKDSAVLAGLMAHEFHPMLTDIIVWVADTYGLVMTESYRLPYRPGDVHSTDPVRAVDIRSHCYDDKLAEKIKNEINDKWEYDSNRPHMKCAIIHDVGKGVHFHIQVHPNTVRREHTWI